MPIKDPAEAQAYQQRYSRMHRTRIVAGIRRRRHEKKDRAITLRGGKCERCGYTGPALAWHHRDPSEKDFTPANGRTLGWERYWAEVQKCDLLCANCHIEEHSLAS